MMLHLLSRRNNVNPNQLVAVSLLFRFNAVNCAGHCGGIRQQGRH